VRVGGTSTGAITLGATTLDNGVTLTIGTGIANSITIDSVSGTVGGAASNLVINTSTDATINGNVGTDIGTFTSLADTLTTADISTTGAITLNANGLTAAGTIRSTGGGIISFAPATSGGQVGIGTGVVTGGLDLGDILNRTTTSGLVIVGSTGSGGSGAITVGGTVDVSANGYSSFSLRSQNGNLNFGSASGSLLLPQGTAVDIRLGTGQVVGSYGQNNVNLSLSAPGGSLQFISAGAVTLGTDVGTLTAASTDVRTGGFVLVNQSGLTVQGGYNTGANADLLIQTLSGNVQLNSGASFAGRNLTIAPAQNFYNLTQSNPFRNQGGRTLVYANNSLENRPQSVDAGLTGFGAVFRVPQSIGSFLTGPGVYAVLNPSQIPAGNTVVYAGNPVIPDLPTGTGLVEGFANTGAYTDTVPTLGYPMPRAYEGAIRLGFKGGLAKKNGPASGVVGESLPVGERQDEQKRSPERLRLRDMTGDQPQVPEGERVGQQEKVPGRLNVGQIPRPAAPEPKTAETTPAPSLREGVGRPISLRFSEDYLPFEIRPVTEKSEKISESR